MFNPFKDLNIINEAEVWFIDNGILPSSVHYNLYTQKQVLKYPNAVAVLGVGKTRNGNKIGFAIEVVQGQGAVYGGILEPDGVAMRGKEGLMRTITENKLLIDVMQEMAQEHRTALAYYERIANEKGISLMEAMRKYPLPEYQQSSASSRSAKQAQPKPKTFTLPFALKEKPDYTPTIGISSNQRASSFITLIKKITIGYLKSMAEDDSDFVFACVSEPAFDDDQLTIDNANIIGQFIHDYVWHTMAENTSISNSHRLIYGTKYTPFLLKVTNNFHPDKSVQGVQIYVESLIDYYVEKAIADFESHEPQSVPIAIPDTSKPKTFKESSNDLQEQTNEYVYDTTFYYIICIFLALAFVTQLFYDPPSFTTGSGIILMWLAFSPIPAYALWQAGKPFKNGYNLLFLFSSPFAMIFWLEVFFSWQTDSDKNQEQIKETITHQAPDLAIQPLPNTGDTDNPNFYGNNPLTIKTQSGKNYWIKISNSVNDMAMASYFIRGGDTLNVTVPTGSYTIKYASGDSWYGTAYLFGKETQYAKADEVFEFNNNGYTIELIYQTNGNLHTKGLDANQF